jgi:hypothetical protein
MSSKLVVVINGQAVIEYDRSKRLPGHQRQFLDKMDTDMDKGVELAGEFVSQPDIQTRAKYIAMHLINAIVQDNAGKIAALSAYLATRLPDLKQVKANEFQDQFSFDLVFDKEYNNAVSVQFDSSTKRPH